MGPLEPLGVSGALVQPSSGFLCLSDAVGNCLGALSGPSWVLLGRFRAGLEARLGVLEASWVVLGLP